MHIAVLGDTKFTEEGVFREIIEDLIWQYYNYEEIEKEKLRLVDMYIHSNHDQRTIQEILQAAESFEGVPTATLLSPAERVTIVTEQQGDDKPYSPIIDFVKNWCFDKRQKHIETNMFMASITDQPVDIAIVFLDSLDIDDETKDSMYALRALCEQLDITFAVIRKQVQEPEE